MRKKEESEKLSGKSMTNDIKLIKLIKLFQDNVWSMKTIFTKKLTLNKSTFKTNDFLMMLESHFDLW